MQETVNCILEGKMIQDTVTLGFSCSKIEISLQKGMDYEGSFRIHGAKEIYTNGHVFSSDIRMECCVKEFTGSEAEISYRFHGKDTGEGDVIKGTFGIVSNCGEYYVPFVVSVEPAVLESSIGPIKNLFHFANLAKSNWREAVRMFYSPEFRNIFTGSDMQHYESYRGLSAVTGQEQNVEEFLIQINKKQKIEYLVENSTLELDLPEAEEMTEAIVRDIKISRNGWGYTALNVECDGDFLFVTKDVILEDDFLANRYKLQVYIDPAALVPGINYGRVVLFNSYTCVEIEVNVKTSEPIITNRGRLTEKKNRLAIMKSYQRFRMKKVNAVTWIKENNRLIDNLIAADEKDAVARLYKAHLLITEERMNEAGWMLDHTRDMLLQEQTSLQRGEEAEFAAKWSYYLYLTTLTSDDTAYIRQVTSEVEKNQKRYPGSWQLAWLLMYLSEEYNQSPITKWNFLEKQFYNGSTSFVIYTEALILLNNNPSLLRKLDLFEQQVIHYGVKQDVLNYEVVEQFLYLVGKVKGSPVLVERILSNLYNKKTDVKILQELCTLYIRDGKVGPEYFRWYRLGVEEQLRITNLYEYYMLSLDMDEMHLLPKAVLLYFSYRNHLDYERTAYLYHYILENRELCGELYHTYEERIQQFALDQIKKGRISRHLAYIYSTVLKPDMIDEDNVEALSKLLFANRICVSDSRLKKVLVYHPNCLVPSEYPLTDRETWVCLYGNDFAIFFEDAFGNRFAKNAEYTLEKLMLPGRYTKKLAEFMLDNPELNLYLLENDRTADQPSDVRLQRMERIIRDERIQDTVRHSYVFELLDYYYDKDCMEELDRLLEETDWSGFEQKERAQVLKYMVLRGKYQSAYSMVEQFGPYFGEPAILLRLVNAKLGDSDTVESPLLTATASYVYERGKYNGGILEYLCRNYNGLSKDLRNLWKTAREFGTEPVELTERFLIQMMYSGAFVGEQMEIFRYYVSQGGRSDVKEAFFIRCSYDYFVREKLTDRFLFCEMNRCSRDGMKLKKVCQLAYLKYCAENWPELEESMLPLMERCLKNMLAQKIHLNFFRSLPLPDGLENELRDKTIVEYTAKPGAKARIHYVIQKEEGDSGEYLSEYMRDVYGGVCTKEFVLFFGETLQYYVTEEADGEEQLTESDSVQKSEMDYVRQESRFDKINDVIISRTMEDYDALDEALEDYYRAEYYNSRLFTLE